MRKMRTVLFAALVATVAAGMWSVPASSQTTLNVSSVGAALAFPYITSTGGGGFVNNAVADPQLETFVTITNALNSPVILKFNALNGDVAESDGDAWDQHDFQCWVSGRETTLIRIRRFGDQSKAVLECASSSKGTANPSEEVLDGVQEEDVILPGRRGILFVSLKAPDAQSQDNTKLVTDAIFGDWAMVDTDGEFAFGAEGISFQSGSGDNHGGSLFQFDGDEYSPFPSVVASNFIAPDERDANDPNVRDLPRTTATLILFTLDGLTGQAPEVRLGGSYFDDDEQGDSYDHTFKCMDVVSLTTLDPNFEDNQLCDGEGADVVALSGAEGEDDCAGHFDMAGKLVTNAQDDPDAVKQRKRPVHGWIVQSDGTEMDVEAKNIDCDGGVCTIASIEDEESADARFWARTLNASTGAFEPASDDVVRLGIR